MTAIYAWASQAGQIRNGSSPPTADHLGGPIQGSRRRSSLGGRGGSGFQPAMTRAHSRACRLSVIPGNTRVEILGTPADNVGPYRDQYQRH